MSVIRFDSGLSYSQWWLRATLLCGVVALSLLSRALDPSALSWLRFHPSCGAVTGLPCLFCGTTRAVHHLLNGNLAEALYFNWLAFPVVFVALVFSAKLTAELLLGRVVRIDAFRFHLTPRLAVLGAVSVVALWMLQVALALGLHKHELLNPNGLLYALLVR